MPELAFLEAVAAHLSAAVPTANVGSVEPVAGDDLPAIVLSLTELKLEANGIGARSELITNGALPVDIRINLANPVLPSEPDFGLLDSGRTQLTLYHGGLVRADGIDGELLAGDVLVELDGTPPPFTVTDRHVGLLTFPQPLPATGLLSIRYYLGRWERRIARLIGHLQVDLLDTATASVTSLSQTVLDALDPLVAQPVINGLLSIGVDDLSSTGAPEPLHANARRRRLCFAFNFEHNIDRPESSGGVIQRIPVTTDVESVAS